MQKRSIKRELEIYREFAQRLVTLDDLDELLWYVAESVVGQLGFVDCVIYRLDGESNTLFQAAAIGEKTPARRQILNALRIPVGHGITGGVAKSMQPDLVKDTRGDDRYIHDLMSPGSEACVPIVHGNELLGVLDSEHPNIGWFDEQDIETLSAIAALTSAQWVQCETIKQLKHAEKKADAANSAKQDFLANISHEIRTPLNGISGCLEILREDLQKPTHLSTLGLAQRATSDLTALIDQVLEFSLIEAGKIKLNSIDCDLQSLIDDCRGMFESKAQSANLELIVDGIIESGKVHTDFLRVKQVLYNLVHNAIKFTDEGRVSVSINRAATGNLVMKVSDTGVGMDEATQDRIFNRFIIADSSRSRRHGGAGLGLAISRRLVDKLGGTIGVSSTLGKGTTFTVEIPMQDRRCVSRKASDNSKRIPDCRGMRILLAEDSDTNAYIARHFIEKCGAHVTHVKDGKQAVESASKANFDLVLMDVSMPEMDGLQATRIIKQASNIKDVPVVALSAHVAADDLKSCYDAGMCEFLSKPIDKAALYGVLARFSNSKST
ncbi:MAG: ATP-binding protein [Henriciella sp.]